MCALFSVVAQAATNNVVCNDFYTSKIEVETYARIIEWKNSEYQMALKERWTVETEVKNAKYLKSKLRCLLNLKACLKEREKQTRLENIKYEIEKIKDELFSLSKHKENYEKRMHVAEESCLRATQLVENTVESKIDGIENNCSEKVNLAPRPGAGEVKNLHVLSEWLAETNHLVTDWYYDLSHGISLNEIQSVMISFSKDGKSWSQEKDVPVFFRFGSIPMINAPEIMMKISVNHGVIDSFQYNNITIGRAWYVRPKSEQGKYGNGSGESYVNAWSGIDELSKNLNKIEAGDTVFITGQHLHDFEAGKEHGLSYEFIKSGAGPFERVVFRADYPGSNGVIWGAARIIDNGYARWVNEGGGLWSILNTTYIYGADYVFEDIGKSFKFHHKVLGRAMNIDSAGANPGSFFIDLNKSHDPYQNRLYVHMSDSGSPIGRVSFPGWGYAFFNSAKEVRHVEFLNLTYFSPIQSSDLRLLSDITWKGMKFAYGIQRFAPIEIWNGCRNINIIDSEISCVGNGVYFNVDQNPKLIGVTRFLIKGNYVHDIGIRADNKNLDAHCFGLQAVSDGIVEDNICVNAGSGTGVFSWPANEGKYLEGQYWRNNIFRRNLIKSCHNSNTSNFGLAFAPDTNSISDKSGNKVYENIIEKCRFGIFLNAERVPDKERGSKAGIPVEVYDNIIYQVERAVYSYRNSISGSIGPYFTFRNNIVSEVGGYEGKANYFFQYFISQTQLQFPADYYFNSHNNIYYGGGYFGLLGQSYGLYKLQQNVMQSPLVNERLEVGSRQYDYRDYPDKKIEFEEKLRCAYKKLKIPDEFRSVKGECVSE